jgi:hypothetical protein
VGERERERERERESIKLHNKTKTSSSITNLVLHKGEENIKLHNKFGFGQKGLENIIELHCFHHFYSQCLLNAILTKNKLTYPRILKIVHPT